MAKSRRVREVALTKVKKQRGLEVKEAQVDKIREHVRAGQRCFVIELSHCKTRLLQLFREVLKGECGGRLIMSKNRLVQVALGVDKQSALEENIYKLSGLLEGSTALVCCDVERATIEELFAKACAAFTEEAALKGKDFAAVPAHAGDLATETVIIPAGLLEGVPFSQETLLRKLGLPTKLDNAQVYVLGDYTICTEGEVLTKDSAHLLKILGRHQAQPALKMRGAYDKSTHEVTIFM